MKVVVLLGPTASGKSEAAVHLAECFGGEIINADSLQLTRGLEIGTAKPSNALRSRVPHHLYELLAPSESLNAADYAQTARATIQAVVARGRLPILVGGSGFYLKALFEGIAEIPTISPKIRLEIGKLADEKGLTFLWRLLKKVDPESAARLHPADSQRLKRALEVERATG